MKIQIVEDLFSISDRLKEIDDGYYVIYNTTKCRYEVHNSQTPKRFCFVVPYKSLDSRTLEIALSTSTNNSKKIFEQIERNNHNLENQKLQKIKDENSWKFKEIFNYEKLSKQMNTAKSYITKWV